MPAVHDVATSVARRGVHLDAFEDELQASIRDILLEAERELLAALREIDPSAARSNEVKLARLRQLYLQVEESLGRSYDEAVRVLHEGLAGAGGGEIAFATELLETTLKPLAGLVDVNTVAVSPEILRSLANDVMISLGDSQGAAPVADWLREQQADVLKAFRLQMQQGVFNGESIPHLVQRIAGGGKWPGVMKVGRGWAEAVVRTSVTAVTNEARQRVYRENPATIKGVTQVSTRDARTTLICIVYHGRSWQFGDDGTLEPDGHDLPYNGGVPRHVACRSSELPWVKSWEEMGFSKEELPANLRRYLDGETLQETGDTILRGRGAEFQDELLGPVRAKLWREGKIDLRALLDAQGRVRPVAELR